MMTESRTLAEEPAPEMEDDGWTEKTFLVEDRFPFVETCDQALRCYLAPFAFSPDHETPMMLMKMEALFQWVKHGYGAQQSDARPPSPLRRV
jgi:hypothetical protein